MMDVAPALSEKTLTRSKSRVKELGEVFTRPREVNAMLDLVTKNTDLEVETARFLEPSCGNGQFLAEILARKCESIMRSPSDGWTDCTRILRALASIYAIDIDDPNVKDSQNRLFHLALAWRELITGAPASKPWALAAYSILQHTVVRGDFLLGVVVHDVTVTDGWQLVLKPHLIGGGHVKDDKGMYRQR